MELQSINVPSVAEPKKMETIWNFVSVLSVREIMSIVRNIFLLMNIEKDRRREIV